MKKIISLIAAFCLFFSLSVYADVKEDLAKFEQFSQSKEVSEWTILSQEISKRIAKVKTVDEGKRLIPLINNVVERSKILLQALDNLEFDTPELILLREKRKESNILGMGVMQTMAELFDSKNEKQRNELMQRVQQLQGLMAEKQKEIEQINAEIAQKYKVK